MEYIFESNRLGFRLPEDSDRRLFRRMGEDKEVMKYFPSRLSHKETDDFFDRVLVHFEEKGFGLWMVDIKENKEPIGFIGLLEARFESDFTPCIEIGWRLDSSYWNKGYATEGARRVLEYGFNELSLDEIYSFTALVNRPSENVMKKLGMEKIKKFNHPKIDGASDLKEHILYRIEKDEFKKAGRD